MTLDTTIDQPMIDLVLVTGMSGSGKSIALRGLEDHGYECIDNLPIALLEPLLKLRQPTQLHRLAIAIDIRNAGALPELPQRIQELSTDIDGLQFTILFIDASDTTLIRRFSETRRIHPLTTYSEGQTTQNNLLEAIAQEKDLLNDIRSQAYVIDTSLLRPQQLLSYIRAFIKNPHHKATLVFTSFAFKHGLPLDADYVFDVRILPNPYYETALKVKTGLDTEVKDYLEKQPEVKALYQRLVDFLRYVLPAVEHEQRHYLTIAIGCTGGQHRSVHIVEQLAQTFADDQVWTVLKRHRELKTLEW
jgi:UPF0042 nucleotide-binding protein